MAKKKKYDSEDGIWRTVGGRRIFIRKGQDLSSAMKESGKFKTRMNEKAVKGAREEDLKEQYKDSLNNVSKMEYNGEITREEYDEAIKNINKEYKNRKMGDKFYTRKDETNRYKEKTLNDVYSYTDKQIDENKNPLFSREDYEYKLYKRAKENPDSIDPMTENSTDWEALDKKYSGRYEKERNTYESKVFGTDVTKADEQMKKAFGKDFKYDEDKTNKILSENKDLNTQIKKEFDESNLKPSSIYAKSELKTKEDFIERHKQLELSKDRVNKQYELDIKDARMTGNDRLEKAAKEGRIQQLKDIDRLQKENIEKYRKFNNEFHYAGEELYSDDPNRFGDKLRKYNNKMNPSKNDALNKVKNNRIVENVKSGDRFYEVGNGQWRSEKDGYDYYIDFNSSNIDNPKYRDVASGRIINTNPRADNYWDYEGDGLKSKYKGTIDYLRKTTNMNGAEILELLRQIDKDKK